MRRTRDGRVGVTWLRVFSVPDLTVGMAQLPAAGAQRTCRGSGRRFALVFILAVAAACVLAEAKSFREIGSQAADLLQGVLARLGGKPRPLLRRITALARSGSGP